jgi:gliding motility-associated-like protein
LQKVKNHILACLFIVQAIGVFAHGPHIFFTQNQGQWHPNIRYSLRHANGNLYLEQNSLTWFLFDHSIIDRIHGHVKASDIPDSVQAHAIRVKFEGANENPLLIASEKTGFYSNYFLGNDPDKWASHVWSYQQMMYEDMYDGIHLKFYESGELLKYDFIVEKGKDPLQIKINYEGADEVRMSGNNLMIRTSVTDIIEEKPYAYQIIDGIKKEVKCKFHIDKNKKVSFVFPEGYNNEYELIIDPILLFSTFTGSSADNFGFTATYDTQKNTYVGGIVFSIGTYPATAGAFQIAWAGGTGVDIGISKYNTTGTNMIYSTYIGGTSYEAPHSLVTNAAGELFILGTTSSADYPTTAGCFDNTFNGGAFVAPPSSGMSYPNGSDIIVTHLNAAGTALSGSTFIGGTGTDGLNLSFNLAYNYGDAFRGEIIIDAAGNCMVSSTTDSPNFPTTATAPFPIALGGTDAVVFKLNPGLSSMLWSTYFGGNSNDSGYGIQLDSNQEIYVSGGTESGNLLVSPGVINPGYSGAVDGYIVRFSNTGNSILSCTYIGTTGYDQTYFVQLDLNDDVYVVGQTTGNYPITGGAYNNPNSGQFIQKVNKSFTTSLMSTRIGRGTGNVDISPSAFLVNNCGHIYLSGWGGTLNGLYLADFSSTTGLPVTLDALQPTTDGSDFYLMVLDSDASALLYASFFGGPVSAEHVDGGTSRFDKDGVVYQAVCAGCGSNDDFPTTPGAWSNTNNSTNCNLGTFKFDLAEVNAVADFVVTSSYCTFPVSVQFSNNSTGAGTYYWDFGDGDTSTQINPVHDYAGPGTYNAVLIAIDSNTCFGMDTAYLTIIIPPPPTLSATDPNAVCIGDSTTLQLNATGGDVTYLWTPNQYLSDHTIANPIAFPPVTTTYSVTITDTNNCSVTDTITLIIIPEVNAFFNTVSIPCTLPSTVSVTNGSTNAVSYIWNFGDGTPTVTNPDTQHTYTTPGTYTITLIAIDSSTCNISDTAIFSVTITPPLAVTTSPGDTVCTGTAAPVSVSGGDTFVWYPPQDFDDPSLQNPTAYPNGTTNYMVIATDTNGCVDTGFVQMTVFPPASIDAGNNQIYDIGPGMPLNATVPPGNTFYWTPSAGLSCTDCLSPIATPTATTMYYLYYTDAYGCTYVDSVLVQVTSSIYVPNAFTPNGDDKNNVFKPIVHNLSSYELFIFDRWGQLIMQTQDTEAYWDGTFKGVKCPIDVYVWKIIYADSLEPDVYKEIYGHVALIR